jgi:hypothetical protein
MGNLARITETSSKEQNQWEQVKLLQTQQHTSEAAKQNVVQRTSMPPKQEERRWNQANE